MAPFRPSYSVRVGVSKGQAGLAKIIAIISTVPPPRIERGGGNSEAARAGRRGLGLDLNLRLGPPPENLGGSSGNEDDEGGGPTAQSGVVVESGEESTVEKGSGTAPLAVEGGTVSPAERSSEGECDPEDDGEESRKEAKESSGITTAPSTKADDDGDEDEEAMVEVIKKEEDEEEKETKGGVGGGREEASWNRKKGNGSNGYLDLLLEAVRQVSGGSFDEDPAKEKAAEEEEERAEERRAAGVAQGSKRRGTEWLPFHLYDESGPIVRSKRGRSQALPSRYRDSVLDPWRKLPTVTRHGRAARP